METLASRWPNLALPLGQDGGGGRGLGESHGKTWKLCHVRYCVLPAVCAHMKGHVRLLRVLIREGKVDRASSGTPQELARQAVRKTR